MAENLSAIMIIVAIVLGALALKFFVNKVKESKINPLSKRLSKKHLVIFLVVYFVGILILLIYSAMYSYPAAQHFATAGVIIIIPIILALFKKTKKEENKDSSKK